MAAQVQIRDLDKLDKIIADHAGDLDICSFRTAQALARILRSIIPIQGAGMKLTAEPGGIQFDSLAQSIASSLGALQLTLDQPAWFTGDLPEDEAPLWITPGTAGIAVGGTAASGFKMASNWNEVLGISTFPTFVFAHTTLPAADDLEVLDFEYVLGDAIDTYTTAAYGDTGDRPTDHYFPLGVVDTVRGAVVCASFGQGSFIIEEYARDIGKTTGQATALKSRLTHHRGS